MIYNKLVRDKIEDIMIKKGCKPITRILSDEEYALELDKKLVEEINEYIESKDILELVDIEEIIRAILNLRGISYEEFELMRKEKVLKRGAFENKIFLEKEDN
ncbi:MAG: nucleoside triphosphate pyrophosphohydrolase [Tenericutes bacterium]|nr:nucleoside triphosphate pyrophosphohydrolase [Mycoplasmatota bacterium]